MDNELENTVETTEQKTNKDSEKESVDLTELQKKLKAQAEEIEKLRKANTNASADASKWKKQYQEKLSDEEKAKQQQDEAAAAMRNELEMLRKERDIAKFTGALTASDIGMDADTAKAVAEALNANETDKVFDGIRKFITAHDKALRESAFRNNPTLTGGGDPGKAISKEQFDAMSYTQRLEVFDKYPDLYKEYTK